VIYEAQQIWVLLVWFLMKIENGSDFQPNLIGEAYTLLWIGKK